MALKRDMTIGELIVAVCITISTSLFLLYGGRWVGSMETKQNETVRIGNENKENIKELTRTVNDNREDEEKELFNLNTRVVRVESKVDGFLGQYNADNPPPIVKFRKK